MGVVHRDIKTDNILVGRYSEEFITLKIADFGLSEILLNEEQVMTLKCGTPGYFAPEIFSGKGYS